jgi:D-alanyl-lipoteichoic acid acyltransferase DltB (MBOAT superfamily)
MFITQLSTMLLIGLWHGITWNFLLWGAWHGLGIFIHNRWSNFIRPYAAQWILNPLYQKASTIFGIFFTFHFVALGWVFFVLPAPDDSWHVFLRLFGF